MKYTYLEPFFTENGFTFGRESSKFDVYVKGEHMIEICKPCKIFYHKLNGNPIKVLINDKFPQWVEYLKTIK